MVLPALPGLACESRPSRSPRLAQPVLMTAGSGKTCSRLSRLSVTCTFSTLGARKGRAAGFLTVFSTLTVSIFTL